MASKFLSSPLKVLDRIYRLVDATTPREIETDLPVQLVHDVGRQAELGGPAMGLFLAGNDDVHVGAGTIESSWNPYDEVGFLFPNNTGLDIWVWLLDCWATISTDTLTEIVLVAGYAPFGESIPRRDRPIRRWNATAGIFDQNVAPATLPRGALATTGADPKAAFPLPIFPGSTMRQRTTVTGAATVRVEGLFWAGYMGSLPPGM